ncbi:MAG: hypothetical protein KGH75_00210 [Rhodospirillales bacterium]|nr:hypothetical protein [Rhodospirillales bacterium]
MTTTKHCDAEVTIGGATYRCGRPPRHTEDAFLELPSLHQCEGHEHPVDGKVYRMSWTSPTEVVHYREEPARGD